MFVAFSLFSSGNAVNFDNLKPGSFPPYWTAADTEPGPSPALWEIRRDSTAPTMSNVFEQLSTTGSNSVFSMATYNRVVCRDGDLSVKFKIAGGPRKVKAAGIVWRYQDPQNYYLLRFNTDDRNIAIFRVQNGQMRPLPVLHGRPGEVGVAHDLRTGQWYAAKVIFRGKIFHVVFENRQLFDAVDDALPMAGKTGLWTRGGTVASFDDFRIDRKG